MTDSSAGGKAGGQRRFSLIFCAEPPDFRSCFVQKRQIFAHVLCKAAGFSLMFCARTLDFPFTPGFSANR
jgi:hypothetical protein